MPRPLAHPAPPGRYSYRRITEEIARQMQREGRGATARLAKALRIGSDQFSHRMGGRKARFTVEQLGAIADAITEKGAPIGWPFYPWEVCEQAFTREGRPETRRIEQGSSRKRKRNGASRP